MFMFGSFALWANLFGHLEKIDRYAPGHQVRFGSLNYIADIRGDLIFDGFETAVMTHKYRGSIVVLSISKSVKPNEEQKEMISGFQQGILCKH